MEGPVLLERCSIILHRGHLHFPLQRSAWYSARVVESPTRGAWTLERTERRHVPAWPARLAMRRLQPDLEQLTQALEAGGWRAEPNAPLRYWRPVLTAVAVG